jgi:hypothetical protein
MMLLGLGLWVGVCLWTGPRKKASCPDLLRSLERSPTRSSADGTPNLKSGNVSSSPLSISKPAAPIYPSPHPHPASPPLCPRSQPPHIHLRLHRIRSRSRDAVGRRGRRLRPRAVRAAGGPVLLEGQQRAGTDSPPLLRELPHLRLPDSPCK